MWEKGEKGSYWDIEKFIIKRKTPAYLFLAGITSSFVARGGLSLVFLPAQTCCPGKSLASTGSPRAEGRKEA